MGIGLKDTEYRVFRDLTTDIVRKTKKRPKWSLKMDKKHKIPPFVSKAKQDKIYGKLYIAERKAFTPEM